MSKLSVRLNKWAEDHPTLSPWVIFGLFGLILLCLRVYFNSPPINAYFYCWDRDTDKYYENGPAPHHFGFRVKGDHLCTRRELMWPHLVEHDYD